MPVPFPEQKIAVLRELCLAIRNGGSENFQRKKKIHISRNNIKNLNGVTFLSLNSGFEWMFSNTINHCSSVQSFICKYAYLYLINFSLRYCLTGSEGSQLCVLLDVSARTLLDTQEKHLLCAIVMDM